MKFLQESLQLTQKLGNNCVPNKPKNANRNEAGEMTMTSCLQNYLCYDDFLLIFTLSC